MTLDQKLKLEFNTVEAQLSQRYHSMTLYDALGVSPNATQDQLKKRYIGKMLKYHPDRNTAPDAAQRCKDINVVYGILSNPEKRAAYDQWLREKAKPPTEQRYSSSPIEPVKSWAQRAYAYSQETSQQKKVPEKTLENRLKQFRRDKIPLSKLLEGLSPDQSQRVLVNVGAYYKKKMDGIENELGKSAKAWLRRQQELEDMANLFDN